MRRHVLDQRLGNQVVVLRRLENPLLPVIHRLNDGRRADRGYQWGLRLGHEIEHGQRCRRRRRADQRIHLLFGNQFLDVGYGIGWIGRIVEHDVLDFLPADLAWQQGDGLLLRNADDGRRSGRGGNDANLDVGDRQAVEQEQGKQGRDFARQGELRKLCRNEYYKEGLAGGGALKANGLRFLAGHSAFLVGPHGLEPWTKGL